MGTLKRMFKYLFTGIKCLSIEIYKLLKSIFYGLFKVLDFFFTVVFTAFMYIFIGGSNAFKFIYKIFKTIFIKILYPIFYEVFNIMKAFISGLFIFTKFIFYSIPLFIFNMVGSCINFVYKKIKKYIEKIGIFFKELPNRIKSYFVYKFNNLNIVKHYRNKKERELEVLYIDKTSKDAERTEEKHVYKYLAKNKDGKYIKGYFSALSKLDTHSYLLDEGYEVYNIKTNKWIDFLHGDSQLFTSKMKMKDLIFWLTQLSTYVKAGVPLTDSVKILAAQNKKKAYKHVYDSIIYELTMGESFSSALEKQKNMFPSLLINMLKASELIGDLEGTLDEMSQYYTDIEDTKKTVKSALTYPSIILIFAIGVVTFILVYIIPQFVSVYNQSNIKLNPLTIFIINLSTFIKTKYYIIILATVGIVCIFIVLYKNIKAFRTFVQFILMHLPIIGKILIYKEITLFSKTFSSLEKNSILLTDSMDILGKITSNEIYKMIMFDTISNLLRGDKMSTAFKGHWAVPELAYHMMVTGESTSQAAVMLEKVSEYYQKEQRSLVGTVKAFIEPVMIAFLAIIVGGIIIAVIVPMIGLWEGVL
ncbi:MAG: type II secretion system F family protein [Bacilli bacterium]